MSLEVYKVGRIEENWHPHLAEYTEEFKSEITLFDQKEAKKLCALLNFTLEKARNSKKGCACLTWKGHYFDVWDSDIKYVIRRDRIE